MKKVSLILAALALVLGISQCKKQENPENGKLVTQNVTFTTSFDNGSKVGVEANEGTLDLSWEKNDVIKVTDDAQTPNVSTLTCTEVSADGKSGTFTGTITCTEGANLTFSYGTEPNYKSHHITAITQEQIYLVGESPYVSSGNYNVNMEMPYAILYLDLVKLAPESGSNDVTVIIGENEVAKVTNVSKDDSQVYLLLPMTVTGETTLTLSNGNTTIFRTYYLAPNSFNTLGGTGDAALVKNTFTIDVNGTSVEFAPGNLYWNGSVFKFEDNQWSHPTTWDESHVGYFFWSKDAYVAYAASYSSQGASTTDEFFTNQNGFTVNGETGWRTLSNAEWGYLIGAANPCRPNASALRAYKELDGVKGLVILPDCAYAAVMGNINTTADLAIYDAVFLPSAGNYDNGIWDTDNSYYWSSSPYPDNVGKAYYLIGASGQAGMNANWRNKGVSVRLVR